MFHHRVWLWPSGPSWVLLPLPQVLPALLVEQQGVQQPKMPGHQEPERSLAWQTGDGGARSSCQPQTKSTHLKSQSVRPSEGQTICLCLPKMVHMIVNMFCKPFLGYCHAIAWQYPKTTPPETQLLTNQGSLYRTFFFLNGDTRII